MNIIRDIYEKCMRTTMSSINEVLYFRSNIRDLAKTVYFYHARPRVCKTQVQFDEVMDKLDKYSVVLFGEQHQQPEILKAQLCVMEGMVTKSEEKMQKTGKKSSVSLILEMFNFNQQKILDDFIGNNITIDDLLVSYQNSEGFDLENHYCYLLQAAKLLNVKLVAGFIPKEICNTVVTKGVDQALNTLSSDIPRTDKFYVEGTEEHYQYFQSLITGNTEVVTNKYRRIFPAQVLRDSSLAYKIKQCLKDGENNDTQILAICGSGHVDFNFGVPERIPRDIPVLVVTSRSTDDVLEDNVADLVYHYQNFYPDFDEGFVHP